MMLLDLACYECVQEQLDAGKHNAPVSIPLVLVNNSGVYEFECNKGHACTNIIDNIDFEILFEYGLNALVDDYYREAVSSFASSLERYYEFFIKTAAYSSKNDFESIENMWKKMAKQSERQLGAYIAMYLQVFSKLPIILDEKQTQFRNDVIHRGKIPSKDEAIDFGNTVMHIVGDSLANLRAKLPDTVSEIFGQYGYKKKGDEELENVRKKKGSMAQTLMNVKTTISVLNSNEGNDLFIRTGDITSRIPQIQERRKPRIYSVKGYDVS